MFTSTLLFGVYLMLTGKTWFSVWLGLEINLLSFLPMILLASKNSNEGGLKYFLIQATASLIILQASFTWFILPTPLLFFLIPLSLKLGIAPFHFWLPDVVKNLTWMLNLTLLTVQKIGPLYLLTTIGGANKLFLYVISAISVMVGALGGVNETDIRKLLAFSSISHMGWMLVGAMISISTWVMYLVVYMFMSFSLIILLHKMNILNLSQITFKEKNSIMIMLLFLSLGGFPPFLGFAPKWAILVGVVEFSLNLSVVLVLSSVVTLFYYIRAGLTTLSLSYSGTPSSSYIKLNILPFMFICMNITGGAFYMLMWSSFML
uniref:NADH-ubiquinone oxidoreductase chain 2 n=1 Tax=Proasellus coiffaiti TaxID=1281953 RepID=A0A485M7N9_9CRUS|nr:NADH dehydrogenase subunit 2 [Proasellus coiffaiti]